MTGPDPIAEPIVDPIAEVAGEEILPVPETSISPDPIPADGPREHEFPDRLVVDDLDAIEDWAAENGISLQPRPTSTGWLRYAVVAVTVLALTVYAVAAFT